MLLVGPSVEMAELVKMYELGFVANGFDLEDIVSSINSITSDDVREFKLNSHKAAYNLSSDYYKNDFIHFVSSLLQNN
jgi:L-arabinose isomerase